MKIIKLLRTELYGVFLWTILGASLTFAYQWPLAPTNEQGYVYSTLDECRGSRDHFHDGIDIDGDVGETVYAVASGTVVYFAGGDGLYVGRYGYAHTNPTVDNGSSVNTGNPIATITSASHVHFMDGPDGNEINPLRSGGIYCEGDSEVVIINNIIANNYVINGNGGGIYCKAPAMITNNTIVYNRATPIIVRDTLSWGGGIFCANNSIVIKDNIIAFNGAEIGEAYFVLTAPRF